MTLEKLIKEALKYGVIVAEGGGRHYEVTLSLPDGMRWEDELHQLVTSEWAGESDAKVRDSAFGDLMNHVAGISKCPDNCPCKEVD